MKNLFILLFLFLFLFFTSVTHAQLEGDEVLQLHSDTTIEMNAMSNPQTGHIIHNSTTNTLWYYDGSNWVETSKVGPTVYTGSFIINANGNKTIIGLPFKPSQITFVAHANIEALNVDVGSNTNDTRVNLFWGSMNSFARIDNGNITQQVIFIGQNGRETGSPYINNISKYASNSNCIGIRYANENGSKIGLLTASLTSFNSDGFTINVSRNNDATSENLVVLYTAYR